MNPIVQTFILTASAVRLLPHIGLYMTHRKQFDEDLRQVQDRRATPLNFVKAMTREKTFRNLFYYRMGEYLSVFIKWLCPPDSTLHIWCPFIGEGAHFEHNYATYLNAERIGKHFYCLQLVTLGTGHSSAWHTEKGANTTPKDRPTIGDNVRITTGAIVAGGVHIGNNVTIGAGAVVLKDVPDGCTVVGNPARIVRQDGNRVDIPL